MFVSKFDLEKHKKLKTMTVITKSYNQLIDKLNFSYFGLISMTILIGSILGGITAMTILKNDAPIFGINFVYECSNDKQCSGNWTSTNKMDCKLVCFRSCSLYTSNPCEYHLIQLKHKQ